MEVQREELECELGVITRADGSAQVKLGRTIVTCGVYGPVEARSSKEKVNKAVIEVILRNETGLPGSYEREMELLILSCCETMILTHLNPHSAISISIQIQNDKGSVIVCIFHALCCSLLDSGIPLRSTFSALSCAFTADGDMITDPTDQQEETATSKLMYVIDRKGNLVGSHSVGVFTMEDYLKGFTAASNTTNQMTDFYRETISRKMSRIKQ